MLPPSTGVAPSGPPENRQTDEMARSIDSTLVPRSGVAAATGNSQLPADHAGLELSSAIGSTAEGDPRRHTEISSYHPLS